MDDLPDQLYLRIMKKSKPAYQVGGGLRWYANWGFTCAHVVVSALRGAVEASAGESLVGQTIPVCLGITSPDVESPICARVEYVGEVEREDIAILSLHSAGQALASASTREQLLEAFRFCPIEGEQLRSYGYQGLLNSSGKLGAWVSALCQGSVQYGFKQLDYTDPKNDIEKGFSGGPIYDKSLKRVVGIVRAKDLQRNSAYFIDARVLHRKILEAFPKLEKLLPPEQRLINRKEIENAFVFFNRYSLISQVRYLLNKYNYHVMPLIIKGNKTCWHSGLAKRLLLDKLSDTDHCEPLRDKPKQIDWPVNQGAYGRDIEACLFELRAQLANEYFIEQDRTVNKENWRAIFLRGLGDEIAGQEHEFNKRKNRPVNTPYRPRMVLNYVIHKPGLSEFDKELMSKIYDDWCGVRREIKIPKFVILFSLVEDAPPLKQSWWQRIAQRKHCVVNDATVVTAFLQKIHSYYPRRLDKQDQLQLVMRLNELHPDDIENWSQLLQWERGYSKALATDLMVFIQEIAQGTGLQMAPINIQFETGVDDITIRHAV